jgi:hypothetical protein
VDPADKKRALRSRPAETALSVPAPVTRRQLLQYKLLQAQDRHPLRRAGLGVLSRARA